MSSRRCFSNEHNFSKTHNSHCRSGSVNLCNRSRKDSSSNFDCLNQSRQRQDNTNICNYKEKKNYGVINNGKKLVNPFSTCRHNHLCELKSDSGKQEKDSQFSLRRNERASYYDNNFFGYEDLSRISRKHSSEPCRHTQMQTPPLSQRSHELLNRSHFNSDAHKQIFGKPEYTNIRQGNNDYHSYNCQKPVFESLINMPQLPSKRETNIQSMSSKEHNEITQNENGYEVLPQRIVDFIPKKSFPRPHSPVVLPFNKSTSQTKIELLFYIGEMTRMQAEQSCRQLASFRLYHRLPTQKISLCNDFPPVLPLFVVYRTSLGELCQYRIISRVVSEWPSAACEIKVDISGEPYFPSLKTLVRYYTTYVIVRNRGGLPDCFPWWKTKADYLTRDAIYDEMLSFDPG